MDNHTTTKQLFFDNTPLGENQAEVLRVVQDALSHSDDGSLFMEYMCSEGFSFEDGALKNTNFETRMGLALSAYYGEASVLCHSGDFSTSALRASANTIKQAATNRVSPNQPAGEPQAKEKDKPKQFYPNLNPLKQYPLKVKTDLLNAVDKYIRTKDERVCQVNVSMTASWQAVRITNGEGKAASDIRPLVRLNIQVTVAQNQRKEIGVFGFGGRYGYEEITKKQRWQNAADQALRQALVNLEAVECPSGEMTVVLANGWPGILLHEAIGHGLEGDFIRKKTSAFSHLKGERVAAKGITVVDDATLPNRRGSVSVDDEGTRGQSTTLIEDGILKGFMHDRLNARLSKTSSSGNGRRESYAHPIMPRMTNTYMLNGKYAPEEILGSVKKGIYAVSFGGGQVDITSGKFVFSSSEAYLVENGKPTYPIKNATLIGDGATALTQIKMVGNDMALDEGIGTCGKEGQMVPVGVGQPSLLIDKITVGGTNL